MRASIVAVVLLALAGCGSGMSALDRGLALARDGRDAIRRAPGPPAAWAQRGLVRARLGDLDGAIQDLTAALERAPVDAEILFNRGNAYIGRGDYDAAIADFTRASLLNPRFARAIFNRGVARALAGDADGGRADRTIVRVRPEAHLFSRKETCHEHYLKAAERRHRLLHIIAAGVSAGGLPRALHGRQQECYQRSNDRDHDQQLDQRKARAPLICAGRGNEHERTPKPNPEYFMA